jgi:hypothetical protein
MTIERHKLGVDGLWHACPSCGYEGGWHVFFKKPEAGGCVHMDLQCPDCKKQVDLGLMVQLCK